jgi:putative flippase GtrA
MTSTLAELRERPGVRYVVVGGSTYILELMVIVVAARLGASPLVAVAVSFWIGLLLSFTLQKLVTFGDNRTHHRVLLPQIATFTLLVLFNFGFTLLVTKALQHVLPTVVIRTLAIGITTMWNFYLYKRRIFRIPVVD